MTPDGTKEDWNWSMRTEYYNNRPNSMVIGTTNVRRSWGHEFQC